MTTKKKPTKKKPAAAKPAARAPAITKPNGPDKGKIRAGGFLAYGPDNKTKSGATRMSDQETQDQAATIEALRARVAQFEEENAKLENEVTDLKQELKAAGERVDAIQERYDARERSLESFLEGEAQGGDKPGENVRPIFGRRFIRGKLPGDKLIKIDTLTNTHTEVSRAEWELIPSSAR